MIPAATQTRTLGRTGFEVSPISLGTGQMDTSGYAQVTEEQAHAIIGAFLEAGGNFIDSARGYGQSERVLGDYFARHGGRERVYIASKCGKLTEREIRTDLETSLRALRTDYVDLYYLHTPPDDPDEMHRVLRIYEQLKNEGLIRAIGASVKGENVTSHVVDLGRQYIRSESIDVLMVIYSIFHQKNGEMLGEAIDKDIGMVARSVLEDGFLTGKYPPGHRFSGHEHTGKRDFRNRWGEKRRDRILGEAERIKQWAVAGPYETLAQVAIRFAVDQPGITNVVLGAKKEHQIRSSMETLSLPPLPQAVRARLMEELGGRSEEFNPGE